MEKDKLEKAAKIYADEICEYLMDYYYDDDEGYTDRELEYGDLIESFKSGAEWLMGQPLSERMTEEERDKIKGFYEDFYQRFLSLKHRDSQMAYYAQCNMITFEEIFGKEMFENKE